MRSTALIDRERFAAGELLRSTTAFVEASGEDGVGVAGVGHLRIFASELRRSVEFYSRVFGFCVVGASRGAGRSALLAAGRFYVSIRERQCLGSDSITEFCCSIIVDDLDRVRANVWNLGIVPVRDGTHEPQLNSPWRARHSFAIRDPDGNEIEVVEQMR